MPAYFSGGRASFSEHFGSVFEIAESMARYYVNQITTNPYHITGRCPNRESFPTTLKNVWEIFEDYLYLAHHKMGLKIHAFVLMPNHFHMLASSGGQAIGPIMCELMTNVSKELNYLSSRINQNWGGKHYKCELNRYHHLMNTYKYIYQNPVRAYLCNQVEDWKYSTLHGLLGQSKLIIPLELDTILFPEGFDESALAWLNQKIEIENLLDVKKALSRKSFQLPKPQSKLHPLENLRI